jgi:hypothetical protein
MMHSFLSTCAYDDIKRIQGDDGSTHHGKKGKLGMRYPSPSQLTISFVKPINTMNTSHASKLKSLEYLYRRPMTVHTLTMPYASEINIIS